MFLSGLSVIIVRVHDKLQGVGGKMAIEKMRETKKKRRRRRMWKKKKRSSSSSSSSSSNKQKTTTTTTTTTPKAQENVSSTERSVGKLFPRSGTQNTKFIALNRIVDGIDFQLMKDMLRSGNLFF